MVDVLLFLTVQLIVVAALIEVLVRCMPRALRTASLENCYRVDGTLSEHRAHRELRGRNRLRRDLMAVFAYVLMAGNGFYFLIDKILMPIPLAVKAVVSYNPDVEVWKQSLRDQRVYADLELWQSYAAANVPSEMDAPEVILRQNLLPIAVGGLLLVVASFVFLQIATIKAYKDFAKGVQTRSEEHFKRDMTRMSVTGSEFAAEMFAAQRASDTV